MPQKPQRPFVPHRTPKTARPTIRASEFRLYRPFLPGSQRETVESVLTIKAAEAIEVQSSSSVPLRPIEDFLATSPVPALEVAVLPLPSLESYQWPSPQP